MRLRELWRLAFRLQLLLSPPKQNHLPKVSECFVTLESVIYVECYLLHVCLSVKRRILGSGFDRLPYKAEGYNYWTWRGHKIHYVVQGEGSPVVLIHGFGASAFHWRLVFLFPHFIFWFQLPIDDVKIGISTLH